MTTFKLFGAEISAPKEREDEIPPLSQLPCAILHTNRGMKERGRVLVMRKTLTRSDVSVHQSRLFIINSKVLWSQLLEEEQLKLLAKEHVEVEVADPKEGRTRMKLRLWQSLNILVLNSGWVKLVKVNKLEAKVHRIELWTFRMGDKLCFDLNVERQRQYHPWWWYIIHSEEFESSYNGISVFGPSYLWILVCLICSVSWFGVGPVGLFFSSGFLWNMHVWVKYERITMKIVSYGL